jgi:hypothetical protein
MAREYGSSVTLMILGERLDPSAVTKALGIRPNQSWAKGEKSKLAPSKRHRWGGWKKWLPPSMRKQPLERQLAYWLRALKGQRTVFGKLNGSGALCALDCFVTTSETASIIIPAAMHEALGRLGLSLRLSFAVNT